MRCAACSLVVLVVLVGVVLAAPAGAEGPVTYQPPVEAPVTDPFRPPATRYGAGNRGLEYATGPGTPVRAAAAGTVAFAGQVGGRLHVTIRHADGLRTTYGPLARTTVRRGGVVAAGTVVGLAAGPLLWSARAGGAYVDPAVLLAASGTGQVRLVPDRGVRDDRIGHRRPPPRQRPPSVLADATGSAGFGPGRGPR